MTPITVLLADDHEIVRDGLRLLLHLECDIEVIGEAGTGREAVALARKLRPEVVVMDISMPLLNGLEATRQIRRILPGIKVIILSAHDDDAYVDQIANLGASGFLLKQRSSHDLVIAIRAVHEGNTFFSPSALKRMEHRNRASIGRDDQGGKKCNRLSSREMEVLQLIAEGKPNKLVAEELGITFKTVDKFRQKIMMKLDIHDVASLTRYASSHGIIESDVQLTIL